MLLKKDQKSCFKWVLIWLNIDLNLIIKMARNSAPESLLKYDTPILVSSSFKVGSAAGGKRPALPPISEKLG